MRRHRLALSAVAVALAATAAVPASAPAASWGPVGNATRSGQSFGPTVAANSDGRFAVGFVRQLGSAHRAEIRTGRLTDRLRGDSVLLDSSTGNVDSPAVTFAGEEVRSASRGAAWRTGPSGSAGRRSPTTVTSPVPST